jgi:hypothetical protein
MGGVLTQEHHTLIDRVLNGHPKQKADRDICNFSAAGIEKPIEINFDGD